jgi:UDP-2,3-diacylglucosamine pyrophosphatase LpxH
MSGTKRNLEFAIISDVHLGTYGCHARELKQYLRSIKPETLVLNGDIFDIWQFNKRYWPKQHMKVVKELLDMMLAGTKIYYITGNHDEMLRRFAGLKLGELEVVNKLILTVNKEKVWIFHGDVFDVTMQHARWLTKLGATGYDLLILINRLVNQALFAMSRERISLSKRIKKSVKSAVKYINNFERLTAALAIENGCKRVICGHIHHPEIRKIENESGSVIYMNSGDWVENLTALEYNEDVWKLYKYTEDIESADQKDEETSDLNTKELFHLLVSEFRINQAVS